MLRHMHLACKPKSDKSGPVDKSFFLTECVHSAVFRFTNNN